MCEVSIIIPTYNDWQRLALCLKELENQSFPQQDFEVIVVNNNPHDTMPSSLKLPNNCTFLTEAKPGSYAARNTALKIAKGNILGFTDSDCVPHKDWIQNAVALFKARPEITRIAGHIELFYKSEKLNLAELYEKTYAFKQDFAASVGVSVTGNMFTYRHVFDKVGNFNESLLSGGDNEWGRRANEAGYKILYGKEVVIYHPARSEWKEMVKKYKRMGGFYGRSKAASLWRFGKYLLPPLRSFTLPSNLTVLEKIRVFCFRYYLNLTRSVEEVKISFGKSANRS